jgi:sulfur carrier protein
MTMSDDTITLNGECVPMTSRDIFGLLAEKNIGSDRGGVAVAVNGEVVPRAEWSQTPLQPNDKIEIVHIVRGG